MRRIIPWILSGAVFIAIAVPIGLRSGARSSPGKLVPKRDLIVWQSPSDAKPGAFRAVESTFELANPGGTPVRIVSIEAGCGCTRPRVEPTLIDPGKTAVVHVEGQPFPIGEKTVYITLGTDSLVTPTVRLGLRMIGNRPPPFILQALGDLTYSGSESPSDARKVEVITVEGEAKDGRRPHPTSPLPGFRAEFVKVVEQPYTVPGTKQRTYRFRVSFDRPPSGETLSGSVWIEDPWNSDLRQRIEVFAKAQSAIQVVPSRIVLKARSSAQPPVQEFLIVSEAGVTGFTIGPENVGLNGIAIEPIADGVSARVKRYRAKLWRATSFRAHTDSSSVGLAWSAGRISRSK